MRLQLQQRRPSVTAVATTAALLRGAAALGERLAAFQVRRENTLRSLPAKSLGKTAGVPNLLYPQKTKTMIRRGEQSEFRQGWLRPEFTEQQGQAGC